MACCLRQAALAELDCQAFLRPLAGDDALRAHAEAVHLAVMHRRCTGAGWAAAAGMQACALLRYLAILPADKAFHQAGAAAVRYAQVTSHATQGPWTCNSVLGAVWTQLSCILPFRRMLQSFRDRWKQANWDKEVRDIRDGEPMPQCGL